MEDFKSIYFQIGKEFGKMEVISKLSTEMLQSSTDSFKSILETHDKTMNAIMEAQENIFDAIMEAHKNTLNKLTEKQTKSIIDMCNIIDTSAESFTEIRESLSLPILEEDPCDDK